MPHPSRTGPRPVPLSFEVVLRLSSTPAVADRDRPDARLLDAKSHRLRARNSEGADAGTGVRLGESSRSGNERRAPGHDVVQDDDVLEVIETTPNPHRVEVLLRVGAATWSHA